MIIPAPLPPTLPDGIACPFYWDEVELDMCAYVIDVKCCDEEAVRSPIDLAGRIVSHKDYERLLRNRCMETVIAKGLEQTADYAHCAGYKEIINL